MPTLYIPVAALQYGFKTYLGIVPTVTNWNSTADEFSLVFDSNPLTEFVELPPDSHKQLHYSQMICGTIRGALEMLNLEVHAKFVQDQLRDDQVNEIRVKLIKKIRETVPAGDD
ncbi:unnamed protein product [Soboliphyme baturini]|uniref:Trafficking protein particle complex subunit n=1 Tax=Soboliphyme baturini TaxID=241478 RepID=A0A183IL79_9BILA|nr:unnamed protein product [Soboliphyme baturini]